MINNVEIWFGAFKSFSQRITRVQGAETDESRKCAKEDIFSNSPQSGDDEGSRVASSFLNQVEENFGAKNFYLDLPVAQELAVLVHGVAGLPAPHLPSSPMPKWLEEAWKNPEKLFDGFGGIALDHSCIPAGEDQKNILREKAFEQLSSAHGYFVEMASFFERIKSL